MTVIVVFPIAVREPVLHRFEERGAGERGHDSQLDGINTGAFQSFERVAKHVRRIMVEADHDPRLDVHAVAVERRDGLPVLLGGVESFLLRRQGFGIERFEAYKDPGAAGALHGREQLFIFPNGKRGLGGPSFAQRGQAFEKRKRIFAVHREIVVDEHEHAALERRHLFHHILDRTREETALVKLRYRTEPAGVAASHRRERGMSGHVLALVEQMPRQSLRDSAADIALVAALESARLNVLAYPLPCPIGGSRDDRVGVLEGLAGVQCRVVTAHHHRDAAFPEMSAQLIGAGRQRRHGGDPDQVEHAVRNVLELFIDEGNLRVFGRQFGYRQQRQHGKPERFAVEEPPPPDTAPISGRWCNQQHLHDRALRLFGSKQFMYELIGRNHARLPRGDGLFLSKPSS